MTNRALERERRPRRHFDGKQKYYYKQTGYGTWTTVKIKLSFKEFRELLVLHYGEKFLILISSLFIEGRKHDAGMLNDSRTLSVHVLQ